MTIKKDALAKGVRRFTSDGRKYIIIDLAVMYEEDLGEAAGVGAHDGLLDELEVLNSPFRQVAISRPELQAALDELRDNMDDSHFWFIDGADNGPNVSPNLELLADYGLALQHIMHIVGEDKFVVKARLPPSKTVDLDNLRPTR